MARKGRFAKGSPSYLKRRKVAEAIAAKNPGIPMSEKFAVATNIVKGVKMRRGKRNRYGMPI